MRSERRILPGVLCDGVRVHGRACRQPAAWLSLIWLLFLIVASTGRAAQQFDVFLGYDGIVPEASWFPVVCEVKNDGPSFTGTVELSGGPYNNQEQMLRMPVELPTGTLKRFVLPVFSSSRGSSWDVRLLDERGKVRAEQPAMRPRKQIVRGTPLLGAVPRNAGGTPVIKEVQIATQGMQPLAARLLPSLFPDNPLVLEGLSALYLNSERAADLGVNQVEALLSWLYAGGHLVVAVEQPSDISSSSWLKNLFPCEVRELKTQARHPELQEWLRSPAWSTNYVPDQAYGPSQQAAATMRRRYGMAPGFPQQPVPPELADDSSPFQDLGTDLDFEAAPLQVAAGTVRDGMVQVGTGELPLVLTAQRGRGRLTALLFSPEREPVRSWRHLPIFWAKLLEVPAAWYKLKNVNAPGGYSSDGIFGAMIDSRQVHKLPVGWLLLLLLVYLVVIGPFDQYWLKRIGKPMLTWITFPCYVLLFSLLIYFIGYKLRAGESEWNELHLVDVLGSGEQAHLRGRTYSSVYSPANQRYTLQSQQKYATFRPEYSGVFGVQSSPRSAVLQMGDSFKAEIFVPVWSSELYVSDWWQPAASPMVVQISAQPDGWSVRLENHTDSRLTNLSLVISGRIVPLGEAPARQVRTFSVKKEQGAALQSFVLNNSRDFPAVVSSRRSALGSSSKGQLEDKINGSIAASFLTYAARTDFGGSFSQPPGLDLTPVIEHGGAVLLAWAEGYAPVPPMYQFNPRRSHHDTLWRVAATVK